MRRTILFGALALSMANAISQPKAKEFGNLYMEGIPEIPGQLTERMGQYQNTRSAALLSWHPDGNSMMVSTRFAETSQLHMVGHPGAARKQITFFKEPVGMGSFCPVEGKEAFIFSRDQGGNEFAQLFWFDVNSGNHELVSDGGRTQNRLAAWSGKGDRFITVSTRRNGKDYDLYLSHIDKPQDAQLILQQGGSWGLLDWSPDERQLLVVNRISANKSFIHILDLETGELQQINPSKEDISYGEAIWTADGKGIFIVNDEHSEFKTLKYYDLATKKFAPVTASIKWDVASLVKNKDRSRFVFSVNENGYSRLYELNPVTKTFTALEGLPVGIISGIKFNPRKAELGMTINSPQTPGDVYSYDLQAKRLIQWTYSEVGGLGNAAFAVPVLIEYETFDKVGKSPRKIPAFYYKPKDVEKAPVLINIHGGPEAQSRPGFNSFISYLTNEMGIAVVSPNVRGSSGYGKTYLKMDNGFLREDAVKDIGALIEWIKKQPELDASRICVMGGSYGGYMTLASMVHFNDQIKCGIDIVGISNFVTFLKNTEDYRRDLRRVEYGDERDPKMNAFLEKISPANNVGKITKPLFIIQGQNDPRVPASEAEQMLGKMKEKGGEVWFLMARDEGHGFKKKNNSDFMQLSIVSFLEEKLIK